MPSISPSPTKRPSITHRTSSTASLSSSGKPTTPKAQRPHLVARGHGRTPSHGKGLSKLARNNSSTNVVAEATRGHQRKKSGNTPPSTSPRVPPIKRNSSHVLLTKNNSHVNLRKNHSAINLVRNVSHPALKRVGLAPPAAKQRAQEEINKDDVFKLGNQSSEEEEAEWEDSATLSPEITRNNSKTSTPARALTPTSAQEDPIPQKPPDREPRPEQTSSPPTPSLRNYNRSAPSLAQRAATGRLRLSDADHHNQPAIPALLPHGPRASRAPPAMSTISAVVAPHPLPRSDSSRSFTHISHADAISPQSAFAQPLTPGATGSSSADGGVSHFLISSSTPSSTTRPAADEGSDYDSSNFLANYHPLPSQSPEKSKLTNNKTVLPHVPSRTQQRLELQRRETMRAGAAAPTSTPATTMRFGFGSTASLHSRSGSAGRNRSSAAAGEAKAMKREFETANRQLGVVRRFRNPFLESLSRLRESGLLPQDAGVITPASAGFKSRPQSRRGLTGGNVNGMLKPGSGVSRSFEEKKSSPMGSRSNNHARGSGRIQLQRQGSHDDIALSRSKGSEYGDGEEDESGEEIDGLNKEEVMLRRLWDTREIYDRSANASGIGLAMGLGMRGEREDGG